MRQERERRKAFEGQNRRREKDEVEDKEGTP